MLPRGKLRRLESRRIVPSSVEFCAVSSSHSGGFATVREAVQDGKRVAVKQMRIMGHADVDRVLRLAIREAEFLVDLSHENIIQLEGLVEDTSNGMIWLVFPWEEHGNLYSFIASRDWEIPERLFFINDVARGVEYLHSQTPPICHGDLKSLNVLVSASYRSVITDFGSARCIRPTNTSTAISGDPSPRRNTLGEGEAAIPAVQLTTTGGGVTLTAGKYTVRWAAPELLYEGTESLACDIWSLGWIAYEVMFGRIPFHDVIGEAAVITRVIQGNVPCLTDDARMALIQALSTLMMQCWSLDPNQRPKAEDCKIALSWMPMIVPAPATGISQREARLREAELNMKLGTMYTLQSDTRSASDCYTMAIAIFTGYGLVERRVAGLEALANVHLRQNAYDEALKLYSDALQIRIDIGDKVGSAVPLWGLAQVHLMHNHYDEAAKLYSDVLQIGTDVGDRAGRASALGGLADIYRRQNEYDKAVKLYSEELQLRTDIGDRGGEASALWSLALINRLQHQYDDAAKLYSEALQICKDIGDRAVGAGALWGLAEVHRMRNEYDTATKLYSESLQISTEIGDKDGRASVLYSLGDIYLAQSKYDEAARLYDEALQIRTDIGDERGRACILLALADVYYSQDELHKAVKAYSEALQIFKEVGYRDGVSFVSERLAKTQGLQSSLRRRLQKLVSQCHRRLRDLTTSRHPSIHSNSV